MTTMQTDRLQRQALRLLTFSAILAGLSLTVSGPSATAASPPLTCLLANGQQQIQGTPGQPQGPPMVITGTGTNSNQNTASNAAVSNWQQHVYAYGGAYTSWFNAGNKSNFCTSSKPAFQWIYTCTARAQPCKS